jgi:hypothetical protein
MAGKQQSGHQGQVKDPAHDGRLKGHHGGEAAEAHDTKDRHRQGEQNQQSKAGSHSSSKSDASRSQGNAGQSDDLKAREYTDAQGNVHHHTKAYMEQHKGE